MQKRKRAAKPEILKPPTENMITMAGSQAEIIEPVIVIQGLTIADIQCMSVIQLHHLIRGKYAGFNELLDVYGRDELQKKLIEKLGL